jgi:exosortase
VKSDATPSPSWKAQFQKISPAELGSQLFVTIALLVLAIPTFIRLGQQVWTMEIGAHGPIVLATGIWLLWRSWPTMAPETRTNPPRLAVDIVIAVVSLMIYVFGRAYDFISLEALGLYGVLIAALLSRFSASTLMKNWFPIFYIGLLLPVPGWLLDRFTAPLKLFVSFVATGIVEPLGIPIVRQGVTMTVGPYQLLVEDACSGLNSLIGLVAITLFYIYLLRNAHWRYSLFLVCLIMPIAILANVIRIVTLICVTYFLGDAVGQGFLHVTTGLFLFAISLVLMFLIDNVAFRFLSRNNGSPP